MNPYLIIIALVGWIASVAGVGYWQHEAGAEGERVAWQDRELKQTAAAAARIRQLQTEARETEHRKAVEVAGISANYEQEKAHVTAEKDRVIADLRNGNLRLRIPIAAGLRAGGGPACPTAPAAGERDGGAGTDLPEPLAESLLALVSEADEVVGQLKACQAVVRQDRAP